MGRAPRSSGRALHPDKNRDPATHKPTRFGLSAAIAHARSI